MKLMGQSGGPDAATHREPAVLLHDAPMLTQAWSSPVGAYLTWLRASGAARGTLRLREHYLSRLAADSALGPWQIELDDLVAFIATPGWKPETRRSARAAVRDFYKWAHLTDRVDRNPAQMLPTVTVPAGKPRPTPEQVLRGALDAADSRERLMLLLAAYAGLRCAEIAAVHSDDITDTGLRVRGKGGRVRIVPLHPTILGALGRTGPGYLFPSPRGGHLTAGHVGVLLKRLLGHGWSAHTLRHRFASRVYAQTHNLLAVQELLGHAKPETTRRYTALDDGVLRSAVEAIA